MRFLLLEDDLFHQAMMEEALKRRWPDCELRLAATCAGALQTSREEGFDAYVLDLVLPDGDAMGVLRDLRARGVASPVIVVTGQGDELLAVHAMKEGVSDYIIKRSEYWELLPRSLEECLKTAARGLAPSPDATGRWRVADPEAPETSGAGARVGELQAELNEERGHRWNVEKQLRHRTEFVANVSHDLRTPLTALGNALEILQSDFERELSREVRRFIEIARRGSDKLARILDDLLDMSRLEAGRFDLALEPVDLDRLCREVVEDLRPRAARSRQDLTYTRGADRATVYADAARIRQVLRSLVLHALRSSPPWGAVQLLLEPAEPSPQEGPALKEALRLSLLDSAPRLSSVDLETLFDRYVPGQDQSDEAPRQAGLSLPLARELVLAHCGTIHAGASGDGNEIAVVLPAYSESSALLLEFEAEKRKARRQFTSVSLILFRLGNAESAFGGEAPAAGDARVAALLRTLTASIRRHTGKALWWRPAVPPAVAVLASADREGARALSRRLEGALRAAGAAALGFGQPLCLEYGIAVYPAEHLEGDEIIAAALRDREGGFTVA